MGTKRGADQKQQSVQTYIVNDYKVFLHFLQ